MNRLFYYSALVSFILLMSAVAMSQALAVPVLDATPIDFLTSASLFGSCGSPYCSSLSRDYYLKLCGDTAYKYYCGEGNTCQDGACVPKSVGESSACSEGWVGEFYCSSLTPNSRIRLYQNKDCSTTSYKYSCGSSSVCSGGACVSSSSSCESKKLESYCSGLSNARVELWQNSDCFTTSKKYNCGTSEVCKDAKCVPVSSCDSKKLETYCSSLSNSRVELWQNSDCSTSSLKYDCSASQVCSDGKCIKKPVVSCDSKKLESYCSELSNGRVELWQNADCSTTSKKYDCGVGKQCEVDGSDVKCVEKPEPCVSFFCIFGGLLNFSSYLFNYFIFFIVGVAVLYYFRPALVLKFVKNRFFWYAILILLVLGMAYTAFSNVVSSISSWFRWF